MVDKGIPRQDYEIRNEGGENIGRVTSGSLSPGLNIGIGLGYVTKEYSKPDTVIYIAIRNKVLKAVVKKLPLIP